MENINISGLSGGYSDNTFLKVDSLTVEKGTMTAIVGPNGSGKTTLLKYFIKQLKTYDKTIFINRTDINKLKENELAKQVSYVAQSGSHEYDFSVEEYVRLGRYTHNDIDSNEKIVSDSLKQVGIDNIRNKLITEISGGEMQLTMIARAIAQDADIIILDEPTNNLDPKHQLKIIEILQKLKKHKKTIICVMHDLNVVFRYFDNAVMIKEGKIVHSGSVHEIFNEKNIKDVFDVEIKIIPSRDRQPSVVYYTL